LEKRVVRDRWRRSSTTAFGPATNPPRRAHGLPERRSVDRDPVTDGKVLRRAAPVRRGPRSRASRRRRASSRSGRRGRRARERADLSLHREHAVGDQEAPPARLRFLQRRLERREVAWGTMKRFALQRRMPSMIDACSGRRSGRRPLRGGAAERAPRSRSSRTCRGSRRRPKNRAIVSSSSLWSCWVRR